MDTTDASQNKIKFWSDDPNILFQKEHMFEFFPTENMVYEQKLNAITRVVVILTIVAFFYSSNIRILVVGAITLFSIHMLYSYRKSEQEKQKEKNPEKQMHENFDNRALEVLKDKPLPKDIFDSPTSNNPLSNVLVTDYETPSDKKPAPPAYNSNVNGDILKQAKQLVQDLNPDQPDISNKLFKDLGDEFMFEQSMRPFYSTANTRVENDQNAFAEFCFGSMVSCKEGNLFSCARNLDRYQN